MFPHKNLDTESMSPSPEPVGHPEVLIAMMASAFSGMIIGFVAGVLIARVFWN
jgi:hypothetical protein